MKAYTYVKPGLAQFLDVEKPVVCVTDSILFVSKVKNSVREINLHIMKSDVLVSSLIKVLFFFCLSLLIFG